MATPYWQSRHGEVASTQDLARALLERLPVVVMAGSQTAGRGRTGVEWRTAPRALAVSLAMPDPVERRPLSLMAGLAARRALGPRIGLKWPNDLETPAGKAGGILVEQDGSATVVGLGVNLWWPDPPPGFAAIEPADPGEEAGPRIGALWAAELLAMVAVEGWPIEEYRLACTTLGREVTWEPDGAGTAVDVSESGALVVEADGVRSEVHSGAVRHVR